MKRIIDILGAFLLLTITLPITVVVALLLTIQNRGGIIFYQERIGFLEQPTNNAEYKMITNGFIY